MMRCSAEGSLPVAGYSRQLRNQPGCTSAPRVDHGRAATLGVESFKVPGNLADVLHHSNFSRHERRRFLGSVLIIGR
jgi:hypothetical protein